MTKQSAYSDSATQKCIPSTSIWAKSDNFGFWPKHQLTLFRKKLVTFQSWWILDWNTFLESSWPMQQESRIAFWLSCIIKNFSVVFDWDMKLRNSKNIFWFTIANNVINITKLELHKLSFRNWFYEVLTLRNFSKFTDFGEISKFKNKYIFWKLLACRLWITNRILNIINFRHF